MDRKRWPRGCCGSLCQRGLTVTPAPSVALCRHSISPPALARVSSVTSPLRHAPFPHPFLAGLCTAPSLALLCVDWPPWLPRAQLRHPPLHFRRPPAPNPHRLPTATFLSHPPTRLFSCCSPSWGVLSSLPGIGHSSSLRQCLAPSPARSGMALDPLPLGLPLNTLWHGVTYIFPGYHSLN